MREIVSLQVGGYANYVGAHFWNLQDESLAQQPPSGTVSEFSPDVFFRRAAGRNERLPYSPRLQIVDMSGAFGSLSTDTGLVRHSKPDTGPSKPAGDGTLGDDIPWGGQVKRYATEPVPLSRFQLSLEEEDAQADNGQVEDSERMTGVSEDFGLDWNVKYWSDYTKVRFHRRTCYALPGLHFGVHPFSLFDEGAEAAPPTSLEDVYEGLRFFVEDCDSLGGLAITCDTFGGFSGFCERYSTFLRDEIGRQVPMMLFGASSEPLPGSEMDAAAMQVALAQGRLNESLLACSLAEIDIQYFPLRARATQSMPYAHPALSSNFQTSAILGMVADGVLAPTRHVGSSRTMRNVVSLLRPIPGAFLSGAGLAMPIVEPVKFRTSALLEVPGMTRLSIPLPSPQASPPNRARSSALAAELVVARGVMGDFPAICRTSTRVAIPVPFPRFFDGRISMTGFLPHADVAGNKVASGQLTEVGEVDSLTSAYTDAREGSAALRAYASALKRAATSGPSGNVEPETYSNMSEQMISLAGDYDELHP